MCKYTNHHSKYKDHLWLTPILSKEGVCCSSKIDNTFLRSGGTHLYLRGGHSPPFYLLFGAVYWSRLPEGISAVNVTLVLRNQCHGYRWLGNIRNQGISGHGIDLDIPEYSGFSPQRVKTWAKYFMSVRYLKSIFDESKICVIKVSAMLYTVECCYRVVQFITIWPSARQWQQ